MISLFKKLRDNYVINQVNRAKLTVFETDSIERYRVIFSGRVQGVGFRLEVSELANKLELTGFCKNIDNGDVLVEIQGPKNKIMYLISFMESLKRIRIDNKEIEILEINNNEMKFLKQ